MNEHVQDAVVKLLKLGFYVWNIVPLAKRLNLGGYLSDTGLVFSKVHPTLGTRLGHIPGYHESMLSLSIIVIFTAVSILLTFFLRREIRAYALLIDFVVFALALVHFEETLIRLLGIAILLMVINRILNSKLYSNI